jgi:hypothetical protein
MLLGALGVLETAMRVRGVPHVGGGVDAAAAYLAETMRD